MGEGAIGWGGWPPPWSWWAWPSWCPSVMFLILGCVATNASVVGVGLTRRLFTADHRLVRLDRATA